MSDSENICVCCKHPIVDETIEGDVTLEHGYTFVEFENLAVGEDSGCRNCAIILDALSTFWGGEDQSSRHSEVDVRSNLERQELVIDTGIEIEVMRYSDTLRNFELSKSGVWNVKESRLHSEDTALQVTMRKIQEWKSRCMQHHKHCMQRTAVSLPRRILEITAGYVFLREQPGSLALYACLSHCWGLNGPACKLTAESVGHLRDGVKTSDLPKTFRDAIEVCRHLGIHYIWIDALCILQDDDQDWKEAAATMGDIYENSHITIAATASQDSNGGLFLSDRLVTRRMGKHPHLHVGPLLYKFATKVDTIIPTSRPLLNRAWVYQERKLSQRTIHFSEDQVYWECQTGFASEDSEQDGMWNTYTTDLKNSFVLDWGDKCVDHKTYWHKTVKEYTRLKMTYESDRLPAIAAVVDRMRRLQRVDDIYIAGLWENSILSDLLWSACGNEPRPARVAPSWSWVSAQNSVIVWDGFEFTKETEVVRLVYTVVGAANLGEVTNANIILMVPVLNLTGFGGLDPAEDVEIRWTSRFRDMSKAAVIMDQFTQKNLEISHTRFCPDYDLTTSNPPFEPCRTIKLLVARNSYKDIGGIVVQQTSENASEYRRIGFLYVYLNKTKYGMKADTDRLILSLPMEEVKII